MLAFLQRLFELPGLFRFRLRDPFELDEDVRSDLGRRDRPVQAHESLLAGRASFQDHAHGHLLGDDRAEQRHWPAAATVATRNLVLVDSVGHAEGEGAGGAGQDRAADVGVRGRVGVGGGLQHDRPPGVVRPCERAGEDERAPERDRREGLRQHELGLLLDRPGGLRRVFDGEAFTGAGAVRGHQLVVVAGLKPGRGLFDPFRPGRRGRAFERPGSGRFAEGRRGAVLEVVGRRQRQWIDRALEHGRGPGHVSDPPGLDDRRPGRPFARGEGDRREREREAHQSQGQRDHRAFDPEVVHARIPSLFSLSRARPSLRSATDARHALVGSPS